MGFYRWHVIRRTSKKGKVFWLVRGVRRISYESRLRNEPAADYSMYFDKENVANAIALAMNIQEKERKLNESATNDFYAIAAR